MSEARSAVSPAYYLLPVFLGIVGGAIAYYILKDRDHKKARNCMIIGIIITAAGTAGSLILEYGTVLPAVSVPDPGMNHADAGLAHFIDFTGYIPDWATGKKPHQILSLCAFAILPYNEHVVDYRWCNEYVGRTLDSVASRVEEFTDSNGYTPKWAKGIGPNQILAICRVFELPSDDVWCDEYAAHTLDSMLSPTKKFADSTGYTPDWVDGIGPNQLTLLCRDIATPESYVEKDWNWCNEYIDHTLLNSLAPVDQRLSDSAGHTPEWVAGMKHSQITDECHVIEHGPDADWCSEYLPLLLTYGCFGIESDDEDIAYDIPICGEFDTLENPDTSPDGDLRNEYIGYMLDQLE